MIALKKLKKMNVSINGLRNFKYKNYIRAGGGFV